MHTRCSSSSSYCCCCCWDNFLVSRVQFLEVCSKVARFFGYILRVVFKSCKIFVNVLPHVQFLEVCSTHLSEPPFENSSWVLIYTIYPDELNAVAKEPTAADQ